MGLISDAICLNSSNNLFTAIGTTNEERTFCRLQLKPNDSATTQLIRIAFGGKGKAVKEFIGSIPRRVSFLKHRFTLSASGSLFKKFSSPSAHTPSRSRERAARKPHLYILTIDILLLETGPCCFVHL